MRLPRHAPSSSSLTWGTYLSLAGSPRTLGTTRSTPHACLLLPPTLALDTPVGFTVLTPSDSVLPVPEVRLPQWRRL